MMETDEAMLVDETGGELDSEAIVLVDENDIDEDLENELAAVEPPQIVIRTASKDPKAIEISDESIEQIYAALAVEETDADKTISWRLDVIHIRGVQEMNSEEILDYFNNYDPSSIEWVNDFACNVVFDSEKAAAFAMQSLATSLVVKSGEDTADLTLKNLTITQPESLGIPVPPIRWFLAKEHGKSKAILIRFANQNDKKVRGAARMSEYYAKYGRPQRSGGAVNLKRNATFTQRKTQLKRSLSDVEFEEGREMIIHTQKPEQVRMRMRADEEMASRRLRFRQVDGWPDPREEGGQRISALDRLDKRPVKRRRVSSMNVTVDEFNDSISVHIDNSEVPKREKSAKKGSVWSRLSLAKAGGGKRSDVKSRLGFRTKR